MEKVMTVTGYKSYELNIAKLSDPKIFFIKEALRKAIIAFIENGGEWILISGQLGVELWAAEVIRDLRDNYEIKYAVIPPFDEQEKRWSEGEQAMYQKIIAEADFFQLLYQGPYKGPFQFKAKNKWLLEKSDASLILVDEEFPGSVQYYLDIAKQEEKHNSYSIYYLTPFDLEEIVREWNENNNNLLNE